MILFEVSSISPLESLEELLSKFLYKKERADKASMKSDLTKWNYRAKLIKMKAMKIVRRNKFMKDRRN